MKSLWIVILVFLTVGCFGQQLDTTAAIDDKNDANISADNQNQKLKIQTGDSNDSNSNGELLDVIRMGGLNAPDGYMSGDVFNLNFTEFLKEYVNEQGLVNYSKMRRFRLELDRVLERLVNLKPEVYITWSRNEKIAFWINAYNICTLKGIIENYPIKPSRFMLLFYPANSVMHLAGIRTKTYFMIMGIQYTLEEIERDILLGRFEEPRICFAVSYGTMSGAIFRAEPYLGKVLEKQLSEQVKNYLARPDTFKIDEANKVVYLPSILKMYPWHEQAILKSYGTNQLFREHEPIASAILNLIKDYISEANAEFLKKKVYSIEYTQYNWQLNEQPTK